MDVFADLLSEVKVNPAGFLDIKFLAGDGKHANAEHEEEEHRLNCNILPNILQLIHVENYKSEIQKSRIKKSQSPLFY